MAKNTLSAKDIHDYHLSLGEPCSELNELTWIIDTLLIDSHHLREFTDEQWRHIKESINSIPTGRRRKLEHALNNTLYYLQNVCQWQLPIQKEKQFIDKDLNWMSNLHKHNSDAQRLYEIYQNQKKTFLIHQQYELSWTVLVMLIDVAPISLRYWTRILSDPDCIEWFEGQFTLKVVHIAPIASYHTPETPSITRYPLTLFAYRVLLQHFDHLGSEQKLTEKRILSQLNETYSPQLASSSIQGEWQRRAQVIWHYKHVIPAPLLRDISDPCRHVATLDQQFMAVSPLKQQHLYQQPDSHTATKSDKHTKKAKTFTWPHTRLLRFYDQNTANQRQHEVLKPPRGELNLDNVLPYFLYGYIEELSVLGGVKRDTLSNATIKRYQSFYSHIEPLSYAQACDPGQLHEWGHLCFEKLAHFSAEPFHFYQFLRFLSHQDITDHLDLQQFDKPTQPECVDAGRLLPTKVYQIVELLLSSQNGSPIQRLFSATSVLLGYFGALRRGEILRLRCGDIRQCTIDDQRFYLTITQTSEGKTKNRQTRQVCIVAPNFAAKILRIVIKIKSCDHFTHPLLAFHDESIGSREKYYLYPATQAIKIVSGQQTRFHHLRHSGAELLFLQGLHLAYQRTPQHLSHLLGNDPYFQDLLSQDFCERQFYYWLEGRHFYQMNTSVLFDVLAKALGHQYYATTRRNYLHGLERFMPLFSPLKKTYSRHELRFLLAIPTGSNDISRVLANLDSDYHQLTNQEKKEYSPHFSEAELIRYILPKRSKTHDSFTNELKNENAWLGLWSQSLPTNRPHQDTFYWQSQDSIRNLSRSPEAFHHFSLMWKYLGQHHPLHFSNKLKTALYQLNTPKLAMLTPDTDIPPTDEGVSPYHLQIECACNSKTLKAYRSLTQHPLFRKNAHITLFQNRKSYHRNQDKWHLVQNEFGRHNDKKTLVKMDTGSTYLLITWKITIPVVLESQLNQFFHQMLPPLSHQENASC